MPRYDNKDLSFDAPEGWDDKSVVAFEAPRAHGQGFATNLVIMRVDPATPPLATFVTQQIAKLASALPRFELLGQKNTTLAGLTAIEVLFNWSPPDGAITQRMTVFQRQGKTWTMTASALRREWDKALPHFDRVASTLAFASTDGPPQGTPFGVPGRS